MSDRQLDSLRGEAPDGGDTRSERRWGKEPQNRLRKPQHRDIWVKENKPVKRRGPSGRKKTNRSIL